MCMTGYTIPCCGNCPHFNREKNYKSTRLNLDGSITVRYINYCNYWDHPVDENDENCQMHPIELGWEARMLKEVLEGVKY